tara:strand:- start:1486 stop:1959 length:474 start_codon:yes stop_codon:yes gene_type:complete
MPQSFENSSRDKIEDLHVLIVDDDDAFITLIHSMLRALGVTQVTRASNGAEAYQKLRSSQRVIDCIICDYNMDNGNGLQLLQAVRTGTVMPIRPDACFILLTASSDQDTVGNAAALDVSGYLVKPVTKDKVQASIKKARARVIKIDIPRYQRVMLSR